MTYQSPQTPNSLQALIASIQWTNGRGLVTGALMLSVVGGLAYSTGYVAGNNTWTGNNSHAGAESFSGAVTIAGPTTLSGPTTLTLQQCDPTTTAAPVPTGQLYACYGLLVLAQ